VTSSEAVQDSRANGGSASRAAQRERKPGIGSHGGPWDKRNAYRSTLRRRTADPLVTEFRYDPVGKRTVHIDAAGQVIRYSFDERNDLERVEHSPSAWTDPALTPADLLATTYTPAADFTSERHRLAS